MLLICHELVMPLPSQFLLLTEIKVFMCIQILLIFVLFYRGLQQISDEEVVKSYGGRHVGIENISGFYGIVRACDSLLSFS